MKRFIICAFFLFSLASFSYAEQGSLSRDSFEKDLTNLLVAGQWDDVINMCEQAIIKDSDFPLPYLYAGLAYYYKKDYQNAAKYLELAPKTDSNVNTLDFMYLTIAYGRLGDKYKAKEAFNELLSVLEESNKRSVAFFLKELTQINLN